MKRAVVGLFLAALVAGVVGGCGRKGDPQIPAGDKDTLNRVYPTDPNPIVKPASPAPNPSPSQQQ
jgi:predicted small lipoprotein YifL